VLALTLAALWHLDREHARLRGRRRAHGDPLHARTSLLFFCLAFSAAALARLWAQRLDAVAAPQPPLSRVTFASSHFMHAIAIVLFAAMDPSVMPRRTSPASYIFGGIGYAFIIAMTATSSTPPRLRSARAPGGCCTRRRHYLLFQFTTSFGHQRVPEHAALCAVPDPAGCGVCHCANDQHGHQGRAAAG